MKKKKLTIIVIVTTLLLLVSALTFYLIKNSDSLRSLINRDEEIVEVEDEKIFFMFIQNAVSGTMTPVEDVENRYLLTLNDVTPNTIYFSDRPERISGQVSMQEFLNGLGFLEDNPPNAAIEMLDDEGNADVLVVELFSPEYDVETGVLTYEVSILQDEHTGGLAHYNDSKSVEIVESFDGVALFIDDCPDTDVMCKCGDFFYTADVRVGQCWGWVPPGCSPCKGAGGYDRECDKINGYPKGRCESFKW